MVNPKGGAAVGGAAVDIRLNDTRVPGPDSGRELVPDRVIVARCKNRRSITRRLTRHRSLQLQAHTRICRELEHDSRFDRHRATARHRIRQKVGRITLEHLAPGERSTNGSDIVDDESRLCDCRHLSRSYRLRRRTGLLLRASRRNDDPIGFAQSPF
jgi:hypothetical protein